MTMVLNTIESTMPVELGVCDRRRPSHPSSVLIFRPLSILTLSHVFWAYSHTIASEIPENTAYPTAAGETAAIYSKQGAGPAVPWE